MIVGLRDLTGLETVAHPRPGLEAVEANPGSLLTLDGATVGAERVFEAGRVRVKLTRPTGVSGSGVVVVLPGARAASPGVRRVPRILVLTTAAGVERPAASTAARVTVNP